MSVTSSSQPGAPTARPDGWNVTHRRRLLVALALMLITGSWIAWRITHRHDSRLVGRWLFTRGAPPTASELAALSNVDRVEWTLQADGSGMQFSPFRVSFLMSGNRTFTWWTDDDRLCVEFREPRSGWVWVRSTWSDFLQGIRGKTRPLPEVYTYADVEGADIDRPQFVLRFQNAERVEQDDVYCLTRIDSE